RARGTIDRHGLDGLVVVGGEGTLSCARGLHELGFPVVGVPKTIDNDINATEMTFGFETAIEIATEAIDRLHTTAESHDRVMVVEVMGRHVGHIAAWAGMAGGATVTLVPEEPFDIGEVCAVVRRRHDRGRFASVLVVAEGARPVEGTMDMPEDEVDAFGHVRLGGIAHRVADEIGRRTGFETRVTILGHVQRGGTPTAFDRVLASRFGVAAVDAIHEGGLGTMTSLTAGKIVLVPLSEAVAEVKKLDSGLWETAKVFFA
ncbi:MAG: ATP-dependent 6-phosphofructokinase, partial [Acidimicrobiales bacterium]|nr:ATP-dependent 6-phosphofructokinase [Acidimicrobiales bacterium]